ncbi:dihydropteroate synthase [Picrophilus oshimae]|uniref:dihydropteroate synthase n=1 Tax=Picrophilus torridus (strain ATCC 700027 / DSM 9790 / JCM 10055 / NBRC 100828 / KAW 2/3) TaxID=1122961 RepID=Q6L1L6_PICTO|nr:dihydropteroate synthase [Picrophilus oshimae]AAT43136.1 dihydropteroate synthase [Picrophilus oshimae DSM 9789]
MTFYTDPDDGRYILFYHINGEPLIRNKKIVPERLEKNVENVSMIIENYDFLSPFKDIIIKNIFGKRETKIMGILNATPDSFFPGSRVGSDDKIYEMLEEKPDIIDIGGESTRPGSSEVDPETEIKRLEGVLNILKSYNIKISIDSRHYRVIEALLKRYDIDYINDISGFIDKRMIKMASEYKKKCIVMHMRGEPQNMNKFTDYDDIFFEINAFFFDRIKNMINSGIEPENIIIDPGIGFSKNYEQNIKLIKSPWSFAFGFKTLYGTSRKSFIGKITGNDVNKRLGSTIATSIYLAMNNVDILRVHDVSENRSAIELYKMLVT